MTCSPHTPAAGLREALAPPVLATLPVTPLYADNGQFQERSGSFMGFQVITGYLMKWENRRSWSIMMLFYDSRTLPVFITMIRVQYFRYRRSHMVAWQEENKKTRLANPQIKKWNVRVSNFCPFRTILDHVGPFGVGRE